MSRIKDQFISMLGDEKEKPYFALSDEEFRGRLLTVLLALLMTRIIQRKWHAAYPKDPASLGEWTGGILFDQLQDTLNAWCFDEVRDDTFNLCIMDGNQTLLPLLRAFRINDKPSFYSREDMNTLSASVNAF
jgi:hypothetical protein